MLNFIDQMDQMQKMITNTNHVLGKGLTQPMAALNSSIRKNMYATHQDQTLQIMEGEVALVSTGYENEYGRNSSAYVKNEEPFEVLARVEKFTNYIGHHYILLIRYLNSGIYDILERKTGEFIGENYGYIYDNKFIDSLNIGSVVKEDTTISKTISYDEYDNRTDGVNLIGVYMSDNDTTEDGIKVSESARNKLKSPLYHRVEVIVNDNDIMTDLYGAGTVYKPFPDIGEYVNNNLLTVLRRENKDEALFTLSYKRLKDILLSDEKFNVEGKVIDINISGNFNAPLEEVYYNAQLNYYINDGLRYSRDIVNLLGNYINEKCNYDLLYLYNYHKRIISGDKFIKDDKVFSNLIIKFDVLEINKLNVGDKITNRYGGKGVVSKIVPDWDMPVLPDGRRVEIILNSIGPVNRENPGQIIEISHNFITDQILSKGMCVLEDPQDFINILLEFYQIVSPNGLYPYYREALEKMNMIDKEYFVDTIMEYGIISALEPITEALDIDKIYELYERFKYVNQVHLDVPIRDSNGNTRFVPSRRPLVAAKIYMIRLKQYGKEKSSATSLSSTNIKNEPTKPKTNKFYKAPFAKTPIRFGEMEYGDMLHMMNIYAVVSDLLIVSASPMARRECISMYTENPFNVNVKLSPDAKNRNVEILNAYLKTMGLRLKFTKVKREKVVPFAFEAFKIIDGKEVKETLPIEPFIFSKDAIEPFEFEKPIEVFDFIDKNKSLVPFAFTVLEFIQKYIK